MKHRLVLLNVCAAFYGFSLAASLVAIWAGPPRPGQLAGFITSIGIDAHAPFRLMAGLMILPVLMPLALRRVLRTLASDETRAWARNTAAAAMVLTLWFVIINREPKWVALIGAIGISLAWLLRRFEARFTRWDAVLVPTAASVIMALNDALRLPLEQLVVDTLAAVFAVRLLVAAIMRRKAMPPAFAFAVAPLALLLQAHFNARDIRYNGWPPLAVALLAPLVLAPLLRDTPAVQRRMRKALAFVIYPIVVWAYVSATSATTAEGKPRASMFEDGHHAVPANEMLRGEKPYRDVVPAHGFIQDGLFDYLALRTGHDSLGDIIKLRDTFEGLSTIALYALTAGVTGSPNASLLTFFLAAVSGAASGNLRSLPAVVFLAVTAFAMRRRNPRLFAWSGAMVSLSTLVSVDFGAYTFLTLVVALFRVERRLETVKWSAIGVAAVASPAMLWLAIGGVAVDYVRTTFFEVLTLGPVYTLSPFDQPPGLERFHFVPEVVLAVFDKTSYAYVMWVFAVILVGVAFATPKSETASPRRRARFEALLVIATFSVITALSYAERHHLYNHFVVGPLIGSAIFVLFRARLRAARMLAPVMVVLALIAAYPTLHLVIMAMVRNARGPLDQAWREVRDVPRARGAIFHELDAGWVESAKKYVDRMPPGTTWFDFTNRGSLYFLFDRDLPVRHIEVAFYQTEERQRDVIRRLSENPRVVAALVPREPKDLSAVDGIPNEERAPLVWKYLQENFEPDWAEGDIVFWRRK